MPTWQTAPVEIGSSVLATEYSRKRVCNFRVWMYRDVHEGGEIDSVFYKALVVLTISVVARVSVSH